MTDVGRGNVESYDYDFVPSLLGAINEAPPSDHGRILRSYLLDSIDKMHEHSVFQLDLLEKVALIALNNVQDVRLYSLEANIRELEQGEPLTLGSLVGEFFFLIAIELSLIAGLTALGPALSATIAFVITGAKSTTRSRRGLRRSVTQAGATDIDKRLSNLAAEEGRILQRLFNKPPSRNKRRRRQDRKARKIQRAELHAIQDEINFLNNNRDYAVKKVLEDDPQLVQNMIIDAVDENADLHRKLQHVRELVDHYVDGSKSVSRSILSSANTRFPAQFRNSIGDQAAASDTSVELSGSYTTTGAVMQVVSQCETLKLDLMHHYSTMRSLIEFQEDKDVLDALETVLVLAEVESNMLDIIDTSESMAADLEAFTFPMEIAIWLTYLETNGLLQRDESSRTKSVTNSYRENITKFIANDLVELITHTSGIPTDSPRTTYVGRTYHGLHAIDEHQAYYLYYKFAKPAFRQFADKISISRSNSLKDFIHQDVANDAFRDVLAMEKTTFFGGANKERRDLVNEMSVVVIEYFIHLRSHLSQRTTLGFFDEIPEGTAVSTLLNNIEKPIHAERVAESDSDSFSPDDFETAVQDAWEERTLQKLEEMHADYLKALNIYSQFNDVYRGEFRESLPPNVFDDLFFSPLESDLRFARTAIESYARGLKDNEDNKTSEAVSARALELLNIVAECPIEKEPYSLFSR